MGTIRALLVGVCEYLTVKCPSLPLCKNDLFAMRAALIQGLNVNADNILLCGETGIVTKSELIASIHTVLNGATEEDTFVFYFSGHGGKMCIRDREWAPNEKVATEVAIGASIAGVRSMCVMKHVGMNVAADPLYTAAYTGVRGGMVLVVADDPGMYSSQNEQDSRMVARAAMVPVVEPSDSAEAKDFMKYAYDLSEKYDTPVLLRSTTRLSHSQGLVELEDRAEPFDTPYERDIAKYVMMPGNAIKRHVAVEARMKQLAEDADGLPINRVEYNDLSVGFITSGIAYNYVKEAMPEASVLKLGLVNPLPRKLIEEFASKVDKLYIFEEDVYKRQE